MSDSSAPWKMSSALRELSGREESAEGKRMGAATVRFTFRRETGGSMPGRAVVHLNLIQRGESYDIDVPLDINASELYEGLNRAYSLGAQQASDMSQCYVKAENPTVLMHGRKTLGEYGIMNGSVINIAG